MDIVTDAGRPLGTIVTGIGGTTMTLGIGGALGTMVAIIHGTRHGIMDGMDTVPRTGIMAGVGEAATMLRVPFVEQPTSLAVLSLETAVLQIIARWATVPVLMEPVATPDLHGEAVAAVAVSAAVMAVAVSVVADAQLQADVTSAVEGRNVLSMNVLIM